jgi:L-malate glycosyltransferase
LLSNEDELKKMKTQAFEHASKYDIQNIIPQYEKLYSRFCRMETCV